MKLKRECRRETIIKKSRFIACVCPVSSENEARDYIASIRKEFSDASHVCTAYLIGENNEIRRSSDNGEPARTAGIPMLEALLNSGFQNVCACVVRYFGGIKLGTGGLARAYGGAVSDVLSDAPSARTITAEVYSIRYPYALSGAIDPYLHAHAEITDLQYADEVHCIAETTEKDFADSIRSLSRGKVQPELIDHVQKEI